MWGEWINHENGKTIQNDPENENDIIKGQSERMLLSIKSYYHISWYLSKLLKEMIEQNDNYLLKGK